MVHPASLGKLLATLGLGSLAIPAAPPPSYEQQLAIFQGLGFTLNAGITETDLLRWPGGRKAFEEQPYALLYATLGQTIEREPWTPLTDRCWDFDTEAIEDSGSYVRIIRELGRISRGDLVFTAISDHVDIDKGEAWVDFTLGKDHVHWDLAVDNDWVDPKLFTHLAQLTANHGARGRFTYFDTGGQDVVIGYETEEGREKLRAMTSLAIEWLK